MWRCRFRYVLLLLVTCAPFAGGCGQRVSPKAVNGSPPTALFFVFGVRRITRFLQQLTAATQEAADRGRYNRLPALFYPW